MQRTDDRSRMRRRALPMLALATLAGAWCAPGLAQAPYPSRTARLVVPFTPGGSTDLVGRYMAQRYTQLWSSQVIVDNRPGAGGTLGAELVSKAPPDGYTMLLAGLGALAISPHLNRKLGYDSLRDLAPVSNLVVVTNALLVHPSLPVKTVRELIALAQRRPGALNYASPGIGTNLHLGGELFRLMANIDVVHVPYKGSAPATTDLMGGQVSMLWDNLPAAMPYIKSGRMRALGVTTSQRATQLPDVPTIAEAGVPGYESESLFTLVMPAGTPAEIIERVSADTGRILSTAEARERMEQLGARAAPTTPAALGARIRDEHAKWGKVIRTLGLTAE